LVVDDRTARTRSASSGSTFSTSAKLTLNSVWIRGAPAGHGARIGASLHVATAAPRDNEPTTGALRSRPNATNDFQGSQRAGVRCYLEGDGPGARSGTRIGGGRASTDNADYVRPCIASDVPFRVSRRPP
jgi:hypothetical protein